MITRVDVPPPYLTVVGANRTGGEFGGGFYWRGGGGALHEIYGGGYASATFSSPYVGWQLVCGRSACPDNSSYIQVFQIHVFATETTGPNILATSPLWYQTGWIRGTWPLGFSATDPSGSCDVRAFLNGQGLQGPTAGRDQTRWQQCPNLAFNQNVNTANYPDGILQLVLQANNAANVATTDVENLKVDNVAPAIGLSGPQDAPSSAGVQYITANASAGGSGVSGISCSLDGAPPQLYSGASTAIPVQGLGVHHLSCTASNYAKDAAGNLGTSAPATWTLSIRQPSVSTVSFGRVVDGLGCTRARERVRVPAQWVTARFRGRPVRVRVPAQTRTITVVRCHPRFALRRVRIHGRWRTERVAVLPRAVEQTVKRVGFGATSTITGWLGTTQGVALGGQTVQILTAPDNGQHLWSQATLATTAADGSWAARLTAGPSRIVQAVFGGSPALEPSSSRLARVVVPASVSTSIRPRKTHWGGTITISGRVRGGYVPPAGELVVLRVGWSGGSTEIGHLYTRRDGRFRTTYTFLRGNGTETYRLWIETATESDYPFAPSRSRAVAVTVGP